ncbi:AraC family transcriptional regulator [Caballeronia sp. LP003]|uniref:helix-turn-helix domain-containing protein n=1 Tax=Caballeronia sp. LP003 TaxID=3038551 RepID=UPI00286230C8|nr:AraC family transcriptional regulator [Caballeronia sp. LP003]MDR5785272.1 AraC family transcriptional regulator [Caballeronia sp. LP003]
MIPLVRLMEDCSGVSRGDVRVEDIKEAFVSARHNPLAEHRHDYLEIFLVQRGRGTIRTANGSVILEPRCICVLPPGTVHSWSVWSDLHGYLLRVPRSCTERIAGLILPVEPTITTASVEEMQRLSILAEWIQAAESDSTSYGKVISLTRLRLFTLELMVVTGGVRLESCTNVSRLLYDRFLTMVESNFHARLTVPEYAARLRIGKERLSRITQEIANETPGAIIKKRVMAEAVNLVANSETRLGTIAEDLGFPSAAYFSRAFKQATGSSPSAMRKEPAVSKLKRDSGFDI